MIFKQVQQVLDGTKTQTRRPVKEGQEANRWDIETDVINEVIRPSVRSFDTWRSVWVVGHTYAVQPGRGKKAVGRIRITKIRRERLQDIKANIKDTRAEMGYLVPTRAFIWGRRTWFHLRDLWNGIYKKPYRWEDNPEVWALDFERSEG